MKNLVRRGSIANYDFSLIIWLVFIAVLLILIGLPIFWLIRNSFFSLESESFSLINYQTVSIEPRFREAIYNSLLLATGSSCLSLLLGVPTAWIISRTDLPLKSLWRVLLLLVFAMPPFLGAIAWTLLIAPNSGWLNRIYISLTGAETGIFNAYSMWGAIFVIGLSTYPYVFLLTSSALDVVNSELEDAATILGANKGQMTTKITLPLVAPAIIAGGILSFLEAIALFGSPSILLIPARTTVITTEIWQLFQYPPKIELACAFSLCLVLITALLVWVQRSLVARKDYAVITGKVGRKRLLQLGIGRWFALGFCLIVCSLSLFLPVLILLRTALSQSWGRPFGFDNFSWKWFGEVLSNSSTSVAIQNSFFFSAIAATLAMAIALIIAYLVNRRLVPWHQVLSFLPMLPIAIPGVVIAVGIFAAYTRPPLILYGTAAIMIVAFTTRFLPVAFTNANTSVISINPELELAARNLGATSADTVQKVVFPLIKSGLISGWILVFILSIRELSCAILLFTLNTQVMSTALFELVSESSYERLSALAIIMLAIVFTIVLLAYRFLGKDFLLEK
ncbi:MAG: iron ABC transporter permease [Xenococcaceae cyanobacterium MO_188.B32]|nr:iron ABC transporter permease [Xenococcaceae cyanobacterium MO_188.B32]